jgi:hypothetical protein
MNRRKSHSIKWSPHTYHYTKRLDHYYIQLNKQAAGFNLAIDTAI